MKKKSMVPHIKKMAVVLFAAMSLLPAPARAEVKEGSFEVTPFAGFHLFEDRQNLENSPIYGGRLGYNFTKNLGVEGTMEFVNTRINDNSRTAIREGRYISPMDKVDVAYYHLDAVYHFTPESDFTPFLVAGVGGAHYNPKISNQDMTVIDFGVGTKYWLAENIALRFDLRDNLVIDEAYHNVNATVGLVFAFGGATKAAPVAEKTAPCPPVVVAAVTKDTTAPYVTLATPYNASTDAPLHRKARIAFSEAMDPATINANTVTLSRGKEAVKGTVVAPTETSASFTQVDNLQPNTLYTGRVTTGAKDRAGNAMANDYVWSFKTAPANDPKVTTTTKTITINKFVMLEDTHFEYNQAALTPEGKKMLAENIQIMKDNPEMKVRIAGYASAAGTPEYNQDLSERRADAVMTYIIHDGGIAPERLDTIGYGETRPAKYEVNPADINSAAAKANMRVLFEVIVK